MKPDESFVTVGEHTVTEYERKTYMEQEKGRIKVFDAKTGELLYELEVHL